MVSAAPASPTAGRSRTALPAGTVTGSTHPRKTFSHAEGSGGMNPPQLKMDCPSIRPNLPIPDFPVRVSKRSGRPRWLPMLAASRPLMPSSRTTLPPTVETVLVSVSGMIIVLGMEKDPPETGIPPHASP